MPAPIELVPHDLVEVALRKFYKIEFAIGLAKFQSIAVLKNFGFLTISSKNSPFTCLMKNQLYLRLIRDDNWPHSQTMGTNGSDQQSRYGPMTNGTTGRKTVGG